MDKSALFDSDDTIEDLGELPDCEPVPTRRNSNAKVTPGRNHRRTIEEIQEERMLKSMLMDLEQEFPDL